MSSGSAARAIEHVAHRAALGSDDARRKIDARAEELARPLTETARVTLNFHPDREGRDGVTVAQGLLRDGSYRSQFETGITNGSPTAFPGGDRDRWESLLFGGAYDGVTQERPKYGAFNVMRHPDGGSPRFGSCYVELSREMLQRCTFTWGDSYYHPEHAGTIDRFDTVLAAWLEATDLGVLNEHLSRTTDRPHGRALDEYIEAQVHGPIDLALDVEALVIDPAFDDTETGAHLEAIAARYGIALRRHAGFVLHPSDVPSDFRGPHMRPLAERIAGDSDFDAATLGRAARTIGHDPETWQHIKQLWHVLVRFGRPHPRARARTE